MTKSEGFTTYLQLCEGNTSALAERRRPRRRAARSAQRRSSRCARCSSERRSALRERATASPPVAAPSQAEARRGGASDRGGVCFGSLSVALGDGAFLPSPPRGAALRRAPVYLPPG